MKKLLERIVDRIVPYLGFFYLWLITSTSRLKVRGREKIKPGSILASWHSSFSLPVFLLRRLNITCIVSPSEDGYILGRFLRLTGCKVIRGSTRRGSISALRRANEALKEGAILGITPDGPIGPARIPKRGILFFARGGHPIIPVGVAAHPAIRLRSWDGHIVPLPFSKIAVSFGGPLFVKRDQIQVVKEAIDKEEERARQILAEGAPSLWEMLLPTFIYNILSFLLLPSILLSLFLRQIKGKHLRGWRERLAMLPRSRGGIWCHAVSVGEVMAVKPIIEKLHHLEPKRPILLSTTTNTGMETAKKHLSSFAQLFFFPFDLLPLPLIALRRLKPAILCLVETELWPNLIFWARLLRIPIVLVNGRISDNSFVSLRALRFFFAPFLRQIHLLMQSERDAQRVRICGGREVLVLGNTKFDQVLGIKDPARLEKLRTILGIEENEEVFLAGSTHPGEEEKVLQVFWEARLFHPDLRLIVAPRHPERVPQIEALLTKQGFAYIRRSALPTSNLGSKPIILIDTVGELSTLYGVSTVSFVGGSLVPIGGHNILEPLVWGKPVLFGPYMNNFRDIAQLAEREGVGIMVKNGKELGEKLKFLLENPSLRKEIAGKSDALIKKMQGAGNRYAQIIHNLLAGKSK